MARQRIKLETDGLFLAEDGDDNILSEESTGGTSKTSRAKSYIRPSTFWKRFFYFYDKAGKKRNRR